MQRISNRHILPMVLKGLARNALRDQGRARHRFVQELFIAAKCFGAPNVRNIEVSNIRGIDQATVRGGVTRIARNPQYDSFVLAALCQALQCRTVFEIGTYLGETAWLLAHNNPQATIYTLDLPDAGAVGTAKLELTDPAYFDDWNRRAKYLRTIEETRITQLLGDSATFDFSPYYARIDLVFIDASHSYSYVKSDTEAALKMLSDRGTIVWDDYTHYPGIYTYLNELSPQLERPVMHILGTRLALYSRQALVVDR